MSVTWHVSLSTTGSRVQWGNAPGPNWVRPQLVYTWPSSRLWVWGERGPQHIGASSRCENSSLWPSVRIARLCSGGSESLNWGWRSICETCWSVCPGSSWARWCSLVTTLMSPGAWTHVAAVSTCLEVRRTPPHTWLPPRVTDTSQGNSPGLAGLKNYQWDKKNIYMTHYLTGQTGVLNLVDGQIQNWVWPPRRDFSPEPGEDD